MQTPAWLTASTANESVIPLKKSHHFVDKTLHGLSKLLETTIFSDKFADRDGFLQRLDPRIKILTLFGLIFFINIFIKVEILLIVYGLVLLFASISRIELSFFFKRVWIFIPIFAGLVALPSILSIFTPGDPLITFIRYDHPMHFFGLQYTEISITKQGVFGAIQFVLRVATSVSLAILLSLTTHWNDVLKALQSLYIPQIFVLVLAITYQYIFMFIRLVQDTYYAKKSRSFPPLKSQNTIRQERNWIGTQMSSLFRKFYAMVDEVHLAMVARGFRGEVQLLQAFHIHKIDYVWSIFIIILIIGLGLLAPLF